MDHYAVGRAVSCTKIQKGALDVLCLNDQAYTESWREDRGPGPPPNIQTSSTNNCINSDSRGRVMPTSVYYELCLGPLRDRGWGFSLYPQLLRCWLSLYPFRGVQLRHSVWLPCLSSIFSSHSSRCNQAIYCIFDNLCDPRHASFIYYYRDDIKKRMGVP